MWANPTSDRIPVVVTLTASDVAALGESVCPLDCGERNVAAQAAMDAWGLAGVGLRRGTDWLALALVAPAGAVPRTHPLHAGGVDPERAALILVQSGAEASLPAAGRRLCVTLSRALRGQVAGIEAQAGPAGVASPLAPPAELLLKLGFQPVRYPPNRYRLDFTDLVAWVQERLERYRRPAIGLTGSSASRAVLAITRRRLPVPGAVSSWSPTR